MTKGSQTHQYDYIAACARAPTYPGRFKLAVRQQPIQTRTSTNNERDRRPLEPPPIVQISLENADIEEMQDFLQSPYFFMCANLAHPTNDEEVYTPDHNALCGQTVSSMYKLKDINNQDGGFFVLGDLSVKVEGRFRLKLTLFEITLTGAVCLKSIFTEPFTVYAPKNFPGALESTFLSRTFSDQGARIRIRKEQRHLNVGSRKRKLSDNSLAEIPRRKQLQMSAPISPPHQPYDDPGFMEDQKYNNNNERRYITSTMPSPPWIKNNTSSSSTTIRLPSLSHLMAGSEKDVDAAEAMMQLSSSPPITDSILYLNNPLPKRRPW